MARASIKFKKIYFGSKNATQQAKRIRQLYVNKSSKYRRQSLCGNGTLKSYRVCNSQCMAILKDCKICSNIACIDYRYCGKHLAILKHLIVAPSRALHSMGLEGLGLYAVNYNKDMTKDGIGAPKIDKRIIVFNKGDKIDEYVGERFDSQEDPDFLVRYGKRGVRDDTISAAYGLEGEGGYIWDAIAASCALSYSNDPTNIIKLYEKCKTPKEFNTRYEERVDKDKRENIYAKESTKNSGGPSVFYAQKKLYHGDELVWSYGPDYWVADKLRKKLYGEKW
jgi:hypothetical protein